MKKWMLCVLAVATPWFAVQAEPVLFSDNILSLGDAIVVEEKATRYYQQVQMELTKDGDFKVVSGVEKNLAAITDKQINILESLPVQVQLVVNGNMSTPCVELTTAVTRKDNVFYVAIAENPLQTLVACAQVLEPFQSTIALDVKDLGAGSYTVMVNGEPIAFSLN